MRQREEQELSAEVQRELDALDRALAGEPVDAEFDAVATLARDLRAARPTPAEDFADRLDERVADGFPLEQGSPSPFAIRVREWLGGVRPMRLLAPAGAVATIALVASVAVIQSGGGEDATTPVTETTATQGQEAAGDQGAGAGRQGELEAASGAAASENAGIELSAPMNQAQGPSPSGNASDDRVAPGAERELERSATLSLSTDDDEFEEVADGVIEVTDRYDGFVISSNESSTGETSRATFDLKLPSEDLQPALADLSALGHVESRSEDALDITAPTVTARQRLTDARTEVESLLEQLAAADTPKETEDIRFRLDIARADVATAKAEFQRLARRANFADVRVSVASDGGGDGDWGIEEALDDIGEALSTAGGIALISAAIILPFALVIALVAYAWRRSVRRGRERALGE